MMDATTLFKAINQLSSVVVGRDSALKTNDLIDDPLKRVEELTNLAVAEMTAAAQSGDLKSVKQSQRKLESLTSLKNITEAIYDYLE